MSCINLNIKHHLEHFFFFHLKELGLDFFDYFIIVSWNLCFGFFKKEMEILAFIFTGIIVLQGLFMLVFHLLIHDYSRVNCVKSGPKEKGVIVTELPKLNLEQLGNL